MISWSVVFSTLWYATLTVILIKCYLKLTIRTCRSKVCLVGKTAIVTGGNKGIGYETSLGLASRGCKVIIACRSNADRAKEDIVKRTHNPNIITKHLDLSCLDSVRKFCREIHETEEKIDILINNAGIGVDVNVYTKDGLHPTMQTNLFGPFLLTHLLVDLLKKAENARIIFVSSILAFNNNLTLENLNVDEGDMIPLFDSLRIYGNSKLGQILVSNEFSERLKPYGITSNALHPGAIDTEIFDRIEQLNMLSKVGVYLFMLTKTVFFRSPEDGAQRSISMAVSNSFKNVTGTFLWLLRMPPPVTRNRKLRKNVWNQIEKYVKLSEDEKISCPN